MNKKVSYVDFERSILFGLVAKYKDIIENKKIDSTSVHRKQQAWQRITYEYNKHPDVRKRLTKQLKRLWENTKARAKKAPLSSELQVMDQSAECGLDGASVDTELHFAKDVKMQMYLDGEGDQSQSDPLRDQLKGRKSALNTQVEQIDSINMFDSLLSPIISARLKKINDSTEQQKSMHSLTLKREQLQIQALENAAIREQQMHQRQLEHDREIHDLRVKQEKELHNQRMRHEQELHQLKLAEYNKVQAAAAYPILYK